MIDFLKALIETANKYPDRPAVIDHDGTRITTYSELLDVAFRVNAWLREKGLGREDISAIYFTKSMEYIACRIGIMMSGGAWVGLEDLMGKERIDYVIKDSKCKVVFDEKIWAQAIKLEPCEKIADSDPHDLAFIIYTSGSTGTPKGVAHEYGVYENISRGTFGFLGKYASPEPIQFADVAPQTFVSGVYTTIGVFGVRGTIHEISMEMVRNIDALTTYFIEKEIHHTFMTPTFIKLLLRDPRIKLRAASTGGEIVSDVYSDRFDIYNVYGPSEFGYPTCLFKLDKKYENTPIGTATCNSDIVLLDEEGNASDEGTFCIHLLYFRGYLGGMDQDLWVMVDGKKYFRTSDYVKRDKQGRYTVLDRLDDMVKINGNRVDTKEVEAAVKKLSEKVDFCCVKLYRNNGIKSLCAYYTGDCEIDSIAAASKLRQMIPEYMIPSYYIKLKKVPVNANGKVDKRNLPGPKGIVRTRPFAAPQSAIQEKICKALNKVLKLKEDIGIDDDFFMLGGDSITAMEVLSLCEIPGLSVQMIYEGRTAREISALLSLVEGTDIIDEEADMAPLNAMQRLFLEKDLKNPGRCMFNIPIRFDIYVNADMEKIAAAICTAVKAHPALLSRIEKRDGVYYLCHKDKDFSVSVEQMSDDELEKEAALFVRPFEISSEPLFRCRLIRGKSKGMLLLDVYHVICDGYSLQKLATDIKAAFMGDAIPKDYCYALLKDEAKYQASSGYKKDMEYFADIYDKPNQDTFPRPDNETKENTADSVFLPFDFNRDGVYNLEKAYGFGRGGLYAAAAMIAIAAYNDSEDIMLTWTFHGRTDSRRMNSVGLFISDIPLALHLKRGLVLSKLYEDISSQIHNGISHGNVSYWVEKRHYEGNDLACILYQKDIYELSESALGFSKMKELSSNSRACNNDTVDIKILDGKEKFGVLLDYNAKKYYPESMERFGNILGTICKLMISLNPNTTTVGQIIQAALGTL